MAIVVRGLGLPEDGALVAGGLGVSESDPNAMAATITVVGLLSGSLTAMSAPADVADLGGISRRQRVALYRDASAVLVVAIRSVGAGAVTTPTPAPTARIEAVETIMVRVPADVVGAGSGVLVVAARSAATGIRTTFSDGAALLRVGARSSSVGEIAWSISDDEDELFLLLV